MSPFSGLEILSQKFFLCFIVFRENFMPFSHNFIWLHMISHVKLVKIFLFIKFKNWFLIIKYYVLKIWFFACTCDNVRSYEKSSYFICVNIIKFSHVAVFSRVKIGEKNFLREYILHTSILCMCNLILIKKFEGL